MSQSVLLVDRKDGVATLTLNRPEQMNALSMEPRRLLVEELEALRYDEDVGVVIARRHPNPPPEVVAARRADIQQRGRAQAADS